MLRGKEIALSVLAVGTAVAAGIVLRTGFGSQSNDRARASIGARVVEKVPSEATVVDVSSRRLRHISGARQVIERAVSEGANEEWAEVTLHEDGAWETVDMLRRSLPYHDAAGTGYNGVYVRCGSRIVLLDAVGWERIEEVPQ